MSNLLDKASIILTPTAYNNGEALCVKPSDGSGDFDFSRNSAATRVNAQGLVENVQILSSNLVQNGDFSEEGSEEVSNGSFSQEGAQQISNGSFDTDTKWTTNTGWSISGGSANCDGTQSGNTTLVQQNGIKGAIIDFVVGKTYKVNFDVIVTSGHIANVEVASGYDSSFINSSGNHTTYITAVSTNDRFTITANPDFVGSIDNVSVREVGQDWSLGTGWSIGEDKLNFTNVNGSSNQSGVFVIGKTYKITCDYVFTSGTRLILPYDGSNFNSDIVINTPSSAIGYTYYYTPLGGNALFTYSDGNGNGSITNISVKEVGQNWDFSSGAFITDIGARLTHTPTAGTVSSVGYSPLVLGNNYKMTYEITESISGGIKINSAVNPTMVGTVGVHTKYFKADSPSISISRTNSGGNDVTITNISVIEITTDTSLPRINYEGFSYQDALGSELVVNGGFDDGLNGWSPHAGSTLELENGMAKVTTAGGSGFIKRTDLSIETGKTYFCKAYITNGLSPQWFINSVNNPINLSLISENTYGGYVTTNGNNPFFYIRGNNTDGEVSYIDNVSVKEYLGQEVVPDSGCGSWLWESQSTNLITQSELFSDAYWTKIGTSVTNGFTSPDGTNNACKLVEDTSDGSHAFYNSNFSSLNGQSYTYSLFVKYNGRQWFRLWGQYGNSNFSAYFDIQNGLLGSKDIGMTSKIEDYGNGWYRISATATTDGTASRFRGYLAEADNDPFYQGDGTSGVYIWGAQAEQQSYATSYIPTEGTQKTRNQDVCTNGGSLASINSTEGVIYWEGAKLQEASGTQVLGLSDGSGANRIGFQTSATANQIRFVVDAGGNQASKFFVLDDITDFNKLALKWKQDDFSFWVNGIKIGTDTSGNVPALNALNTLDFYYGTGNGTGIYNFTAKTKALAVWKEALSD